VRARSGCALRGDEQLLELKIGIEETIMAWTTPTLVEICIGLEINGYLPAEF
jgi:coenzyme PQQ precursor peptide PqqA